MQVAQTISHIRILHILNKHTLEWCLRSPYLSTLKVLLYTIYNNIMNHWFNLAVLIAAK